MFDRPPDEGHRLHRVEDVALLALASFAVALQGGVFHWQIAAGLLLGASALWLAVGRALHQHDPGNGRGFFDDVALTVGLVVAVMIPLAALHLLVPRLVSAEQAGLVCLALLPTVLLLRVRGAGVTLWNASPRAPALIAGIGPLGRFTEREIGQGGEPRPVAGCLTFDDEFAHDRLSAPVLGRVSDLEAVLRERVIGEVYFASTSGDHSKETQAGIQAKIIQNDGPQKMREFAHVGDGFIDQMQAVGAQ